MIKVCPQPLLSFIRANSPSLCPKLGHKVKQNHKNVHLNNQMLKTFPYNLTKQVRTTNFYKSYKIFEKKALKP